MIGVEPIGAGAIGVPVSAGGSGSGSGGGSGINTAILWSAQVLVDGADVSTSVVGDVTVEAEEGSARIADFSLHYVNDGTVEVFAWTGKPVIINYVDISIGGTQSAVRIFTGVVNLPKVDMATQCLHLTCTDDLQGRISGLTRAEIDTLVGGRWSSAVFDPAASVLTYAQDRLSTVPASLDISAGGTLRMTSWVSKASADLQFDDDWVLDGSLVPSFAERSRMTNQVDVSFGYRFPRQKAEGHQVNYDFIALNQTSFGYWVRDGGTFLTRDAVRSAIQSAGGSIVSEQWIALPETAQVIPGTAGEPAGAWLPNPATDPLLCLGFSIVASFDYSQQTEEEYLITVKNPASIALIGTVRESMSGALEGVYADAVAAETNVLLYRNKISAIPPKDLAPVIVGLTNSANVTLRPDTDRVAAESAMVALIDVAKVKIFAAARRHSVSAAVPLDPFIDLDKTVEIIAGGVHAKGKVAKLKHKMGFEAGEAITEFDLAICKVAGVGVYHPADPTEAAAGSTAGTTTTLEAPVVTWNGEDGGDQVITIDFPGVEDDERLRASVQILQTVRAEINEDVLSIQF